MTAVVVTRRRLRPLARGSRRAAANRTPARLHVDVVQLRETLRYLQPLRELRRYQARLRHRQTYTLRVRPQTTGPGLVATCGCQRWLREVTGLVHADTSYSHHLHDVSTAER